MRVSDLMLSGSFLNNINKSRENIEKLRTQISKGSKISKPSDSPNGTVKLLRLSSQLEQSNIFSKNVQNSLSFLKETTFAMESIQDELIKVITRMAELENAANTNNFSSFADQVDSSIKIILRASNSVYDGKYIFSGTDFSSSPFGYSTGQSNIEIKAGDVSGESFVKISPNASQKINVTGKELFGTILKQSGKFDKADPAGTITNSTAKVYDNSGNEFDLNLTYTKASGNSYTLNYDITDLSGASVFSQSPAAKALQFDPAASKLSSIDGKGLSFNIKSPDNKINFNLDLSGLEESSQAQGFSFSANQQQDIFNTLIKIRDNLRNGIKPAADDIKAVENFNKHILNKLTETGNTINHLEDTELLLENHKIIIEELISKEQSVDIAKAVIDLQNQDYLLQLSYKVAATLLPKSLMDYL